MLQPNLLYAGVTRGKRLVVLVGQRKAIAIAVDNVSGQGRWLKLNEWLGGAPALAQVAAWCGPISCSSRDPSEPSHPEVARRQPAVQDVAGGGKVPCGAQSAAAAKACSSATYPLRGTCAAITIAPREGNERHGEE
jgi:exodeoxyribonuclease V alpha subunit